MTSLLGLRPWNHEFDCCVLFFMIPSVTEPPPVLLGEHSMLETMRQPTSSLRHSYNISFVVLFPVEFNARPNILSTHVTSNCSLWNVWEDGLLRNNDEPGALSNKGSPPGYRGCSQQRNQLAWHRILRTHPWGLRSRCTTWAILDRCPLLGYLFFGNYAVLSGTSIPFFRAGCLFK